MPSEGRTVSEMMTMHWFVVVLLGVAVGSAREVLELEGNTFELALTSHKYLAVLFYDTSAKGQELLQTWDNAAFEIGDDAFPEDCEIAKVLNTLMHMYTLISAFFPALYN
ncbi:hypothetical protein EON65_37940 [archaeon]|nr:MAG: hypothetical protein EON65_37940 [archaeon]